MTPLHRPHAAAFSAPAPVPSPLSQAVRHAALSARRPRRFHALHSPLACAAPATPALSPALKPPTPAAPRAAPFSTRTGAADGEDDRPGAPPVLETDLEEAFVRGSGPGGQKINKTAICVVLKHRPSGLTVKCQETRSQTKNRELARKILQRKLDDAVRGEHSDAAREESKARARKAKRRRKSVSKHFKSKRDRALLDI